MFTFHHAGVECRISASLIGQIGWEMARQLVEYFFANQPPDSVRWVGLDEVADESLGDEELPMYTMSNGSIDILLWPMREGERRILAVQLAEERADIKNKLTFGG